MSLPILSPKLAPVLAQFSQSTQSNQFHLNSHQAAAAGAVGLAVILIGLVVAIGIAVLICWLIASALSHVPEQYRQMSPAAVYLLLIPLFNLVWMFFVAIRVPASFENYFQAAGRTDVGDCGKGIGLAYAICLLCSFIPIIGVLAGLAALVLIIIFIVKLHGYKDQINQAALAEPGPAENL